MVGHAPTTIRLRAKRLAAGRRVVSRLFQSDTELEIGHRGSLLDVGATSSSNSDSRAVGEKCGGITPRLRRCLPPNHHPRSQQTARTNWLSPRFRIESRRSRRSQCHQCCVRVSGHSVKPTAASLHHRYRHHRLIGRCSGRRRSRGPARSRRDFCWLVRWRDVSEPRRRPILECVPDT